MSGTKPTIVLIHGGWHQPSTYQKLTKKLEESGLEVHVPPLPSMNGNRPPDAGLKEDTQFARQFVEKLVKGGKKVIVIMHSYGGQVGTNALKDLRAEARKKENKAGGVTHFIYLCAFALPEHHSMMRKVREFDQENLIPYAFDFADDKSVVSKDPKTLIVGASAEDDTHTHAEVDEYVASLKRWNGQCMYDEIQHAAWREVPVTYVHTTKDMTVPEVYQQSMVKKMEEDGRKVETVTLETGHCPNLTKTDAVAGVIEELTKK